MECFHSSVKIDDSLYKARFEGFEVPMEVSLSNGETVRFLPWTYREHLGCLRASLIPGERGLELDKKAFASFVMKRSGIPEDYWEELENLAVFWAFNINEIILGIVIFESYGAF